MAESPPATTESPGPAAPVVLAEYAAWDYVLDDDDAPDPMIPGELRSWSCVVADDRLDHVAETARIFRADDAARRPPGLIETVIDDEFVPTDALRQRVTNLGTSTSEWVQRLTGEPLTLRLDIHHPNWWPTKGVAAWTAVDRHGIEVPVERLGSGMKRWAQMAIAIAVRNPAAMDLGRGELIIDEPDRALHNAAQLQVAKGFAGVAGQVSTQGVLSAFVASHAPAFLTPNANVVRLIRDADNAVAARRLLLDGPVDQIARELGITRSDVLLTTRWLVLVEGAHDQVIIETLYGAQLEQARARVVPMYGADKVAFSVRVRDLVVYSEARVRLMLDNITPQAQALWEQARSLGVGGQRTAARRAFEELGQRREEECRWLAEAGLAALGEGRLDRVDLVGLSVRDITHYLPVGDFTDKANSWPELWALAPADVKAAGVEFKRWARITTKTVQASIARHRDDDFPELARILEGM